MAYGGFDPFGGFPGGFPGVPPWYPYLQQQQQLRIPQDPSVSSSVSSSLCTYPVSTISWNVDVYTAVRN